MKAKGKDDNWIGMRRSRKERNAKVFRSKNEDEKELDIIWSCDDPELHCFEHAGLARTTVAQYFQQYYRITLKYPKVSRGVVCLCNNSHEGVYSDSHSLLLLT
jgi:hypothetical protein